MKKLFLLFTLILLLGCTEQERAKNFGGTMEFELKPNEELINITWKDNQMWVLTRDTIANQFYFRESSSYGMWEGEVIIKK